MTRRPWIVALGLLFALLFSLGRARPAAADARWHTRLVKSAPQANDTLSASPTTVKLWFSEPVELPVSRIRIIGADGRSIDLPKATRMAGEDNRAFQAAVPTRFAPGRITVQWSTAGRDGHPMRGAFSLIIR